MHSYPEYREESRIPYEGDPDLPKTIAFAVAVMAMFAVGLALLVRGLL